MMLLTMNLVKAILNPEKNFLSIRKEVLKTPAMNFNTASVAPAKRVNRTYSYLAIPLLAVCIPNMAGLITNWLYQFWELALSYLFFIVTGFIIWQGNMR